MSKDNKKVIANKDSDYKVPPLIKFFKMLTANRTKNFRIELFEYCNSFYPAQKLSYVTWKNRYLYPLKNIPKKDFKTIITIMEEALAFHLNKMRDEAQKQVDADTELIKLIEDILKIYNNE